MQIIFLLLKTIITLLYLMAHNIIGTFLAINNFNDAT